MNYKRRVAFHTKETSLKDIYQGILDILQDTNHPNNAVVKQVVDYYENIISCMPGNVYWMSKDCTTVGCNQNVLEMFGLASCEDFYGLSFDQMSEIGHWTSKQGDSFKKDTLEVIQSATAKINVEEPPIPGANNGEDIYFLTTRAPLFNQCNQVIGIVGISTDITALKKAQLALEHEKIAAEKASRAKTEFIRNMEHDLRTPISGIWGVIELLAQRATDDDLKNDLSDVAKSAKELLDYCRDIIDFSNIEYGSQSIVAKPFYLKKLLEEIVAMELPAAKIKNLELTLTLDAELPNVVISDPYRLKRILINIVSNAIKFTNQGYVKISAKLDKPSSNSRNMIVRFSVEDTGIGIPEEKKDLVYEKFSRINPSNQGVYKGSGLGLHIVKKFIDELDGDISLESQVNRGTTFKIFVPCKIPHSADILPPAEISA